MALVTGGSRGIGAAICRELARSGAYVYVNYHHHRDAAQGVLDNITSEGGRASIVHGSVAVPAELDRIFDRIRAEQGRLDILINNAGIIRDEPMAGMSLEAWQEVMNTNLTGAFHCCVRAARFMVARRFGRIVNISSTAGFNPRPQQSNYAASKAGMISLTKSLVLELAQHDVRVNGIAPGCIETDILAEVDKTVVERLTARCPMGRLGSAEEVAHVAMFLLSDAASYVQGQTIIVDGGSSVGQL